MIPLLPSLLFEFVLFGMAWVWHAPQKDALPTHKTLSTILFSRNAPVLVVGDDMGSVDVYRIHGVGSIDDAAAAGSLSADVQEKNLKESMYPDE